MQQTFSIKSYTNQRLNWLKKEIVKPIADELNAIDLSVKLYEKGYSALDVLTILEGNRDSFPHISDLKLNELLLGFNKVKRDIKNEKTLIFFIIHFVYFDNTTSLENLSFI